MKPSDRDFLFYLEDIRIAILKIEECTAKFSDHTALENDWVHYDAVLRNLEVIGEASNQIPNTEKEKFSDIPWSDMYRTRNILIHHYFGIDAEIVWQIITMHLPKCLPYLEEMISSYSKS